MTLTLTNNFSQPTAVTLTRLPYQITDFSLFWFNVFTLLQSETPSPMEKYI